MPRPLVCDAFPTVLLVYLIISGLTWVDRGPLGPGRLSKDLKYWCNAIILPTFVHGRLPVQSLMLLKFPAQKFSQLYFCMARLHAKYTKICTVPKFPATRYTPVNRYSCLFTSQYYPVINVVW